jgi:hypothetical protein
VGYHEPNPLILDDPTSMHWGTVSHVLPSGKNLTV